MAAARAKFDEQGKMVAFYADRVTAAMHDAGTPAATVIEFDPETNPEIVEGINSDWNAWTFERGSLRRRGAAVTIHPPGERKIAEDGYQANLAALRTLGWDGLSAQQRTTIAVFLMLDAGDPAEDLDRAVLSGAR